MWQTAGQETLVALLQRSLKQGGVSHAYLLSGPAHSGKMTLAKDVARALNCGAEEAPCGECSSCRKISHDTHPDVSIISLRVADEDTKAAMSISTEQIDEMQHMANLPPFEGKCKVFIIDGAELLSITAANRLLKTLEEPSPNVVFILLTVNESMVLPTVISRCQKLDMTAMPAFAIEAALAERWGVALEQAKLLSRLAKGRLGWAVGAVENDEPLRWREEVILKMQEVISGRVEERFNYAASLAARFSQSRAAVYEVLGLWKDYWRDLLLVSTGCGDIITNIDQSCHIEKLAAGYTIEQVRGFIGSIIACEEQLGKNANPKLALEVMMLDIPGKETGSRKSAASC